MPDIFDAIISLRPGAAFVVRDDKVEWLDDNQTQPTKKQVEDEIARLQSEYDANEYQRQRAVQYPSIGEQLDMLWHAIDAGTLNKTSNFYKAIKAVKDSNPKSE
jgi:hypothetical protein